VALDHAAPSLHQVSQGDGDLGLVFGVAAFRERVHDQIPPPIGLDPAGEVCRQLVLSSQIPAQVTRRGYQWSLVRSSGRGDRGIGESRRSVGTVLAAEVLFMVDRIANGEQTTARRNGRGELPQSPRASGPRGAGESAASTVRNTMPGAAGEPAGPITFRLPSNRWFPRPMNSLRPSSKGWPGLVAAVQLLFAFHTATALAGENTSAGPGGNDLPTVRIEAVTARE
jgi:hypothetical protein